MIPGGGWPSVIPTTTFNSSDFGTVVLSTYGFARDICLACGDSRIFTNTPEPLCIVCEDWARKTTLKFKQQRAVSLLSRIQKRFFVKSAGSRTTIERPGPGK